MSTNRKLGRGIAYAAVTALFLIPSTANAEEILNQAETDPSSNSLASDTTNETEISLSPTDLPQDPTNSPELQSLSATRAASVECTDSFTVAISSTYARVPAWMPAYGFSYNCYLERGSNNRGVTELQRSLKLCNGQQIAVDGVYGPATEQAIKNVQYRHGLSVDGVYGPATGSAMTWKAYNGRCVRISLH